jgi:hypothetical protein
MAPLKGRAIRIKPARDGEVNKLFAEAVVLGMQRQLDQLSGHYMLFSRPFKMNTQVKQ